MARPIRHWPHAPSAVVDGGRDASLDEGRLIAQARWHLCELAGFAHQAVVTDGDGAPAPRDAVDLAVQVTLRELIGRHREDPPHSLDAYVEALGVIEAHDAQDAFEAWKATRGYGTGGLWPTSDGVRGLHWRQHRVTAAID